MDWCWGVRFPYTHGREDWCGIPVTLLELLTDYSPITQICVSQKRTHSFSLLYPCQQSCKEACSVVIIAWLYSVVQHLYRRANHDKNSEYLTYSNVLQFSMTCIDKAWRQKIIVGFSPPPPKTNKQTHTHTHILHHWHVYTYVHALLTSSLCVLF